MWYVLSECAELDKVALSIRKLLIPLFSNQSTSYCRFPAGWVSAPGCASATTYQKCHLRWSEMLFFFANRKTFSPSSAFRPSFAKSRWFISRLQIRMCRSFQNRIRMPCSPHPKNKVVPVKIHIFCQNWLLCSTLTTGSSHVGSAWFRQWVQRALHDSDSGFNSVSELALTSS